MSKIKLIADSGGGTVSWVAPSSTTSNANLEFKLPVADSAGVFKSDGSGNLSIASGGTVLQTVYSQKGNFDTTSSNTTFATTPEAIIDGCQTQIQITDTTSKILVTFAGMPIIGQRSGPATARIDIGHVSSNSSGVNFAATDYSSLGGSSNGLASTRKAFGNTSSGLEPGSAGPGCVQTLHDHNLAVGQYAYYTLMLKSEYSNNSHGYIFNGGSGYFTCILQEVL